MHTVVHDNKVVVASALSLSIYFGLPSEEQRQALTKFWVGLLPLYRHRLRWYITDAMPFKEPVDEEALAMIPLWFEPGMPTRRRYLYYSHAALDPDEISPWMCELYVYNTSPVPPGRKHLLSVISGVPEEQVREQANCVRFSFPAESAEFPLADFLSLSSDMFHSMPFVHANAGYSLAFDPSLSSLAPRAWLDVMGIALRHPGYDIFEYLSIYKFVFDKIKTVNWITMLGGQFASAFRDSGRSKLLQAADITTTWNENRVLIQAGAGPAIGDINRGDRLPLYREVAAAVDPWICKEHFPFSRVFDEDRTREWLHRFR